MRQSTLNPEDLHPEELPFGEDCDYSITERNDLLYEALQQVAFLAKLILWIRCIYRRDFVDDNGQQIRKFGVRDLTGDLRSHPEYRRYLSEKHPSEDPLDISEYVENLLNIYRQVEMANGAAHSSSE